jgi:transposase
MFVDGLMYILSTGCQWRYTPMHFPPGSTLCHHFDLWTYDGTLDHIHHILYDKCLIQVEREITPTSCVMDSQSVKSADPKGSVSKKKGGAN